MSQEVYKNETGQVLFGNSGNVFRKPYSFSNAFINNGGSRYIKVSNLSVSLDDASMVSLKHRPDSGSSFVTAKATGYSMQLTQRTADTLFATPDSGFIDGQIDVDATNDYAQIYLGNNNGLYTSTVLKTFKASQDTPPQSGIRIDEKDNTGDYTPNTIDEFWIGAGNNNVGTSPVGDTVSVYSNSTAKHKNIMLFNRQLSLDELKHMWNNALYSEPLSLDGCILYFKLELAEILNNGGSDFVGVRNEIVGQPHGEIMNLPVGTLQEQLDYANANLFVPFIS